MSMVLKFVTTFISKEMVFSLLKGLIMDVLAEPLYDAGCELLDEAVKSTDTTIDDEIAANLKEWLYGKLDL